MPGKELFLYGGSLVGPLAVKRRVMSSGGNARFPLIHEPQMIGDLAVLAEDLYPLPQLVDLHLFAD